VVLGFASPIGWLGALGADLTDSLLLMFAGILTGRALMLFSYASKRVRMGTGHGSGADFGNTGTVISLSPDSRFGKNPGQIVGAVLCVAVIICW